MRTGAQRAPSAPQTDSDAAVADSIGQGRYTLDDREHSLPQNNGPNCLHGGALGTVCGPRDGGDANRRGRARRV